MAYDNAEDREGPPAVPTVEKFALLLVLFGAVGLVASAWAWEPAAAGALLSVELIVAGIVLGLDR